jgi:acyl-CoA synthetase (AMP-forming)/AMP-acid ligase II
MAKTPAIKEVEPSQAHADRAGAKFNIASYLPQAAAIEPARAALVVTRSRDGAGKAIYASMTFAELEALSNRYANGLLTAGLARGMRTLVMVRPGFDFISLTFALFKIGAVPVMIDPGMGVGRMLECVRSVAPRAFVGIPLAQVMRMIRRAPFRSVEHVVTVGRRWFWGGPSLDELRGRAGSEAVMADTARDEMAAILFTSGATGPAKGVVYEHGMFDAQVRAIRDHYGIRPGEVDLPGFPLFALFNPAMGMTSVIPDMDPTRPARVDPVKIVEAIRDHDVTNTFGSPAMWTRVADYCVDHEITLPSLRRVLVAGAPVPWRVIERLHRVLGPEADVHTPYGATESLPVSTISGREVVRECSAKSRRGAGTCVGKVLPGIEARVIRITDGPIEAWEDELAVPEGQPGEIIVSGKVVTKRYDGLERETALAKIREGDRIWHRIGDIGYRDDEGRIWFCGRKGHRLVTAHGTMYTVPCEAIFNEHPDVYRSALVGVGPRGTHKPVIVVEPVPGRFPRGGRVRRFRQELIDLARANELTRSIDSVLFHRRFPVDVRHNAKINREKLAVWAARRVR